MALLTGLPALGQQPSAEAPPASGRTTRQREWQKATIAERVRLAERLGEEGAQAYASKKAYAPILTKADKSLVQGFDQVYRTKNGSIVVIEAKGGTSAIGRAYGCRQGTPEWAVQAAKRVAGSARASAAEKKAAKLVLEAAREGRLIVEVVRTRHILGEPVAAWLESTLRASQAEGKAAAAILEKASVGMRAPASASQATKSAEAASRAARGARTLSRVGKAVGGVGIVVESAIRANAAVETEKMYRGGKLTREERGTAHRKNAAGMAGGLGGAWLGAKGGAATDGAIGACFGGVGAPIGAALGGVIGAVGGFLGGENLAEKLVDRWPWK